MGMFLCRNPEGDSKGQNLTPAQIVPRPALRGGVIWSGEVLRPRSFNQHGFRPHGSPLKLVVIRHTTEIVFVFPRIPLHSLNMGYYPAHRCYDATPAVKTRHRGTQAVTSRLEVVIHRCLQLEYYVLQELPGVCCV